MKKLFTLLTLALISIGSAWGEVTFLTPNDGDVYWTTTANVVTTPQSWLVDHSTTEKTITPDIDPTTETTGSFSSAGYRLVKKLSDPKYLEVCVRGISDLKVFAFQNGSSTRELWAKVIKVNEDETETEISNSKIADFGTTKGGQMAIISDLDEGNRYKISIYGSNELVIYALKFVASGVKTKTLAHPATDGQTAYLDNSGAISGNDTEPYVAYTMSYSSYPMTITCSTADKGEIQSGSDNYQFTIGGSNYTGAKYSKKTYYIIPDEGATITAVSAYASSNSDKTITIGTYGGTTQDLSARGTSGTPATPSAFPLAKNASGYYEFSLSGAAAQALVVLKVTYSTIESIDVKVSSAGYATLFYDKDLTIPAGVEAYYGKMNGAGDAFEMTQITSGKIPANTGVILKAAAGTYKFLTTSGAEAIAAADNDLTGATTATAVAANSVYTLGQNGEGVVGMRVYSGTSIRAYSAYITGASTAREFVELDIDGYATGIKQMEDVRSKKDDVYYDLQGRRVLYPTKGLYIVNGKKVIVK